MPMGNLYSSSWASAWSRAPGFLLSMVSRMASLGWMTMRSMFGTRPEVSSSPKMRCGGSRNWMATLGVFLSECFAGAEVEGDALPAPVVDEESECGVGGG